LKTDYHRKAVSHELFCAVGNNPRAKSPLPK